LSSLRLSLIAAVARNGVIGVAEGMPWRLSTDLQRFKRLTLGKPVIMGRKTFATIGRPLPGRANIVLTRHRGAPPEGVTFATSLDAALALAATHAAMLGTSEAMVIGGGQVYAETIGRADRLYITRVDASPVGDTHFPPIDPAVWKGISSERIAAGDKDDVATTFVIYERAATADIG
jgi:dihydrofolate reductase